MKVTDIANEIYLENASPSDTSIPSIAYWIRTNVGKLNAIIYEAFYVDPTSLEIFEADGTEIDILPAAIIKMMYKVYRVDLDIRRMMTALQADSVIEAKDLDFSVKRINKSEVLKTLTTMKKDSLKELQDLIHNYRSHKGSPTQVTGDDNVQGHYSGTNDVAYTRGVSMGGGSMS